MGLTRIFISHSGADSAIATRLADNLKNAGHETKVDNQDLGPGDNFITFMNDGITTAETVIILFSKHTPDAKWQNLEMDTAVWKEVEHGGRCIVVRLDDTPIPNILGPKVYGKLDPDNPESMRALVESVCKVTLPAQTASNVVAEALRPGSKNPFRLLRAEFFEDRPDLHAKAFAPPDPLTAEALHESKPCFLEGSRGTGKSMLLLSLRARNLLLREKTSSPPRIMGFYLKLSRGALCNAGLAPDNDVDPVITDPSAQSQLADIGAQELVIQLVESLMSELAHCVANRLIGCDPVMERQLLEATNSVFFEGASPVPSTFGDLLDKLADAHRRVASFIRRRFIYDEVAPVPVTTFDLDQLKRLVGLVRRFVPVLKDSMFAILLDEYENLFPYQQKLVNGFVKLGAPELSVKIAKKLGGHDTSGTTTGQELQEIHDYTRIPLVYDVENHSQRADYQRLLKLIVENILRSSGLSPLDIELVLPESDAAEVDEAELKAEVLTLCKISAEEFDALPSPRRAEKFAYYSQAATYRVLLRAKGRHAEKRFAGFSQLAFLSSGVIRYFQEILGVAYHLTYQRNTPGAADFVLPADKQSRAVHFVSQHNLTTLSRNVERYGEQLKYFLLDLGDCLRYKLLKHGSEPEAARLTIEDPETLGTDALAPLRRVLAVGIREGVFQTKEGLPAFKPKHGSDPQPSEFNICRVYAPVLEISPRLRWRTNVKCGLLMGLLEPGKRAESMRILKNTLARPSIKTSQHALGLAEGEP